MKINSIGTAKTIWVVPLVDLNPRRRFLVPAAEALVRRYAFTKFPDAAAFVSDPPTYAFELGMFQSPIAGPIAVNLTVHGDGLVVENRAPTAAGDEFLVDALSWLSGEFGLPTPRPFQSGNYIPMRSTHRFLILFVCSMKKCNHSATTSAEILEC
jgi:hypothetical protein